MSERSESAFHPCRQWNGVAENRLRESLYLFSELHQEDSIRGHYQIQSTGGRNSRLLARSHVFQGVQKHVRSSLGSLSLGRFLKSVSCQNHETVKDFKVDRPPSRSKRGLEQPCGMKARYTPSSWEAKAFNSSRCEVGLITPADHIRDRSLKPTLDHASPYRNEDLAAKGPRTVDARAETSASFGPQNMTCSVSAQIQCNLTRRRVRCEF